MKLLIVTTHNDKSHRRISEEALKKNINVSTLFYEDLRLHELNEKMFKEFDFCILRDPYNTGEDFSIFLRTIMSFFPEGHVLDYQTYKHYPFYEDKLFQHILFSKHVNMPKFRYFTKIDQVDIAFPAIVKKRISSRGKEIYLLDSMEEAREFAREKKLSDYFFEECMDVKKDIRVVVINGKVIGAVERRRRIKFSGNYRSIGVKVVKGYNPQEEMIEKAVLVSRIIKSDFCGIDFAVDEKERVYLLECNVSPQFVSFERVLNLNVAERLIDFILTLHHQ